MVISFIFLPVNSRKIALEPEYQLKGSYYSAKFRLLSIPLCAATKRHLSFRPKGMADPYRITYAW